jgi:hypothetical protein
VEEFAKALELLKDENLVWSSAIELLKDDNLVWSSDFEAIRKNLARLMEKAWELEYHSLEPEIGDIALNLVRGNNAGRPDAT